LNAVETNLLVYAARRDSASIVGGAVHDARIAALCNHHGVNTLYSADRDFSRFPQLRTENPLL